MNITLLKITMSNNVGRPRRTSNLQETFSSINKAFAVARNTLRVLCLFVIIPLSHEETILSTNQRMVCVASNLPAPFQTPQYPNG